MSSGWAWPPLASVGNGMLNVVRATLSAAGSSYKMSLCCPYRDWVGGMEWWERRFRCPAVGGGAEGVEQSPHSWEKSVHGHKVDEGIHVYKSYKNPSGKLESAWFDLHTMPPHPTQNCICSTTSLRTAYWDLSIDALNFAPTTPSCAVTVLQRFMFTCCGGLTASSGCGSPTGWACIPDRNQQCQLRPQASMIFRQPKKQVSLGTRLGQSHSASTSLSRSADRDKRQGTEGEYWTQHTTGPIIRKLHSSIITCMCFNYCICIRFVHARIYMYK